MRGSSETTKQMPEAPQGAVFIWCNEHLDYVRHLAAKHRRTDLYIKRP